MKSKIGNKERVGHILDSIDFIERALNGVSEDEFQTNFILQAAVQKWFEIIGEASYQITSEYKKEHTEVQWKSIEGLRHILVHDYFGVDLFKIWSLYKEKIPELKTIVTELYKEFE